MKSVQIRSYFCSVFSCIQTETKIYGVNIRIQSEYRRIRTRNNSVFGLFSRSDIVRVTFKPIRFKEFYLIGRILVGLNFHQINYYERKKIISQQKKVKPMIICLFLSLNFCSQNPRWQEINTMVNV